MPPSNWPLEDRVPVVLESDPVGTMSAIVHSPRLNRTIALTQIRRDLAEAKATVQVVSPNRTLEAEIHSRPYV